MALLIATVRFSGKPGPRIWGQGWRRHEPRYNNPMGVKRFVVGMLLVIASVLMVVPAGHAADQADPPDWFSYSMTGDALWDTYAQALLEALRNADDPVALIGSIYPPELPPAMLDGWESRFGADPHYWQLRYWDADRQSVFDEIAEPEPGVFLRRARECGAVDAGTEMLLYEAQLEELEDKWDMLASGELPADAVVSPDSTGVATIYTWYVSERFRLADELVAACPDESWAWYKRAHSGFELGRWEQGLGDLRKGNQAPNNRWPKPFPLSFIDSRIAAGRDCGSPVAVGLALQGEIAQGMPNFIRLKDMLNDQFIRSSIGADLTELAPWHGYICRFGSMEGTSSLFWSTARIMHRMLMKHFLVETPEIFSIDQRDALWGLDGRCSRIKDLAKDAMASDMDELIQAMEQIGSRYGIKIDAPEDPEFLESEQGRSYELEITCAFMAFNYEDYRRVYGEYYPEVRERFELMATFDMERYCWPKGE